MTTTGTGSVNTPEPRPPIETVPILAALTLAQKVTLLSGAGDWHTEPINIGDGSSALPSIEVGDGPHGLRKETGTDMVWYPATCFPTGSALGSSWDRRLLETVGRALGAEARAAGVDVVLGPGINMKRSPLCGRNFEYFSEDPVHAGELAAGYVQGVQAVGVGTSLKHFAVNSQETSRFWVSEEVDERTLREIYLAAFERVIAKSKPWTVMCSYNRINGVHASRHRWLLTGVLREEWGYDGVVISDWGAVHDRVAALAAGLDLEMPGTGGSVDAEVVAAVGAGVLPADMVDASAERIIDLVAKVTSYQATVAAPALDHDAHHQLARDAATQCVVLLRNERRTLPIDVGSVSGLAVVGEYAIRPRIQGGGSAGVLPTRIDIPLNEITVAAGDRTSVRFELGYQDLEAVDLAGVDGRVIRPGAAAASRDPRSAEELVASAVQLAEDSELTVVYAGLPLIEESEANDRTHLALPIDQIRLLEALARTSTRLVVVLVNGSAIELGAWHDCADAVIQAGLLGQGGGWAVASVIFGGHDPAGRLAETIPARLADTPAYLNFPGERGTARHGEGVFIGYRWYDAVDIEPRYPFGHGLSYTTFAYSPLVVEVIDPGSGLVDVSFTVTNTGSRRGVEIAQLYVCDLEAAVRRPVRELKGFEKAELDPGDSRSVTIRLAGRDFAYYDVGVGGWRREGGDFVIEVGSSSRTIRARAVLTLLDDRSIPPLVDADTLVRDSLGLGG